MLKQFMTVKARCRNCGKEAPSDQFKLHYKLQQMVCPTCYSGKTQKEEQRKREEAPKPAGWDMDDAYLEKVSKVRRQEEKEQFKKIPGTDYVKYACKNCKYEFRYDVFRKTPRSCPYCNADIPKLRTFSML